MPKGGFWTANSGFEPKMQFRFRVWIDGLTLEDQKDGGDVYQDHGSDGAHVWYAKSIEKPTVTLMKNNEAEANLGDFVADIKSLSPPTFKDISMTLIDPSYPNATRKLLRMLRRAGYHDDKAQEINAEKFADPEIESTESWNFDAYRASIGDVRIEQLDWDGKVTETWSLLGAFPLEINFGKLDYSSDDFVEISITWAYKSFKAIMHGTSPIDGTIWPKNGDPRQKEMTERGFEYFRNPSFTSMPLGGRVAEKKEELVIIEEEATEAAGSPVATVEED